MAAFDREPVKIGTTLGNITVSSMQELPQLIQDRNLAIGIVAVPSLQAQDVIDTLVRHGIHGILNYAPIAPQVPSNIVMRNIDPVLSLQSMTFYMKELL